MARQADRPWDWGVSLVRNQLFARTRPLIGFGLLCLSAQSLPSQVRGVVRDGSGRGIPGALVDAWGPARRVAGAVTDSNGHFELTLPSLGRDFAIIVRAIGFGPVRLRVSAATDSLAIRLLPLVTALPQVLVVGRAGICPNRESKTARRLWNAAAGHYWRGALSLDLTLVGSVTTGMVSRDQVGAPDSSKRAFGIESAPARWRHMWREIIADSGYAEVALSNQLDPAVRAWEYAPIETSLSEIFVDSLFGAAHLLSFDAVDSLTLVFCPRKHNRPDIQGTLALDLDSTLLKVTWAFVTPREPENAGGQVLFTPADQDSAGHILLLPASGVYWRQVGPATYFQRRWEYEKWSYAEHRLPTRK